MAEIIDKWYLDGCPPGERLPRRYDLSAFPLVVGRGNGSNIRLSVGAVSSRHAEFAFHDGSLWLTDLHSSNGTFVNGQRVNGSVAVECGDIVHFAQAEFVVGCEAGGGTGRFDSTTALDLTAQQPAERASSNAAALRDLLSGRRVVPYYQPIVTLAGGDRLGFEILGRGAHPDLSASPWELFQLAQKVGLEVALSRVFREAGLEHAAGLPGTPTLFVNAHPAELAAQAVLPAFADLRCRFPDTPLIVEPHESSVTDPAQMRALKVDLASHRIGLAYDDFGTGQSRLRELVEVPPDYLKFDMALIRGIDHAPVAQQRMLEGLVRTVLGLGIACLAEGIERVEELHFCRELGFEYGQGYLLGRPAPLADWQNASGRVSDVTSGGRDTAVPATARTPSTTTL